MNKLKTIFIGLLLVTISSCHTSPAYAHGDADWIEHNPEYKSRVGMHCCGENDCQKYPAELFTIIDGVGIEMNIGNRKQLLKFDEKGIYWNDNPRDAQPNEWWACVSFGMVRCIFPPRRQMF